MPRRRRAQQSEPHPLLITPSVLSRRQREAAGSAKRRPLKTVSQYGLAARDCLARHLGRLQAAPCQPRELHELT